MRCMWVQVHHALNYVIQINTVEKILSISTHNCLIPDMFLKRKSLELQNNLSLKTYPLLLISNGDLMGAGGTQQGTVSLRGYCLRRSISNYLYKDWPVQAFHVLLDI